MRNETNATFRILFWVHSTKLYAFHVQMSLIDANATIIIIIIIIIIIMIIMIIMIIIIIIIIIIITIITFGAFRKLRQHPT